MSLNTHSDPDSETQQQGTNKLRGRNYVDRSVRKPNEIVLANHLDADLSGLQLIDNDYGSGKPIKNAHKMKQNSHGKIPMTSNSDFGNYPEAQIIVKDGGHRRGGTESV